MGFLDALGAGVRGAASFGAGFEEKQTEKDTQKFMVDFTTAVNAGDAGAAQSVVQNASRFVMPDALEKTIPEMEKLRTRGTRDEASKIQLRNLQRESDEATFGIAEQTAGGSGQRFAEGAIRGLTGDIEAGVRENRGLEDLLDIRRRGMAVDESTARAEADRELELEALRAGIAQTKASTGKTEADTERIQGLITSGPKKRTGLVKQKDGSTILVDLDSGDTVKEFAQVSSTLQGGSLGGKKLSPEQVELFDGLNAEVKGRVSEIANGSMLARKLVNLLDHPDVKGNLGRLAGNKADFEAWVTGSATLPPELVVYTSTLYDMIDLSLRERSGAAIKAEEVYQEMEKIIGGTTTDPEAIRIRLENRIQNNTGRIREFTAGRIDLDKLESVDSSSPGDEEPQKPTAQKEEEDPATGTKKILDDGTEAVFNGEDWVMVEGPGRQWQP